MTIRFHILITGLLALLVAALLAIAPASANPTSGGYQLFERAASSISADIQLASLGNFAPPPETASEYANAPNKTVSFETRQIQKKYKHAEEFGISGNYM